ncbi:MAG TPA: Gx transporter family protein [Clostridia bacterium]|nr:Gx transporter family protein [Clostridia bacterium]
MEKNTYNTKKLALLAVLGAQALALSFLENFIPPMPGLPPGAKPGLANIVTMFTASTLGFWQAIYITVIKAVFAGLTRGPTALFMSLSGGVLSTIVMYALLNLKTKPFGIIGISISSAIAHNLGQLVTAMFITGTRLIIGYAPLLSIFSLFTGLVTGAILKAVIPVLKKQSKYFMS